MMDATAGNDVIRTGQIEIRFRLQAAQTEGRMTMFEFLVPAGARVPVPHSHDAFDETVYGLAGVTTWMLEGRRGRQCSRAAQHRTGHGGHATAWSPSSPGGDVMDAAGAWSQ